jgi:hypothetical protein
MVFSWIGVGVSKPISPIAFNISPSNPVVEKELIVFYSFFANYDFLIGLWGVF